MNDESHISLVDSHSECNGSDNDLNFVLHPLLLDVLSFLIVDVRVIEVTLDPMASFE